MILFIDTSDFNGLRLAVIDSAGKVKEQVKSVAFNENYKTNEFLQKFLGKHRVQLKDLSKIIACSGPGSFTGIRVGLSLAQALGFALNIPVSAIPKNKVPADLSKLAAIKGAKTLVVNYGQKPNITKMKK